MAIITTPVWSRRIGRVLGTGAVAGTALLALALPASAHTPKIKAECADGKTTLSINLTAYQPQHDNTVKATDGDTVLVDTTFKANYSNKFDVSATENHTFTVTVGAWDDPDGKQGFSFTQTLTVKACEQAPTTTTKPTETSTSETTTSEVPTSTSTEAPPAPSSTPAPPAQGGLASTGASVALPLTIGALLLVGGGALLLVVRKRRSTT